MQERQMDADALAASVPLAVQVVDDATVSPMQRARMEAHVQHIGVFTTDGALVNSTIEDRRHGAHLYQAADLSIYPEIGVADEDEAIYAGVFFTHYGHFLLESSARLWYAKSHPELPIVWVGLDSWTQQPQLRGWQREILDVLGIRNPTRVLTRPERFATLHLPDAGYKYGNWCHPHHAEFLAAYDDVKQIPGRKLWLSRSNVANGIGIVNSEVIEESLARTGWTFMSPEKMPIRDQLRALAEAEHVAGEEGSAFHSLVLLRDVSNKKFHIFRRHGREHMSFHTIGDVRGVEQTFYSTSSDAVISTAGRDVQRIAPSASQVLNHLRVPIPHVSVEGRPESAALRRVRAILDALNARSYLEVGVGDGLVFNRVVCDRKIGLDSRLRFDPRQFETHGTELYSLSPEDFATYFASEEKFDLLFINNCHFMEEVMSTFAALLPFTHGKSVILIDNVLPSDEYSAMRDGHEALRRRHETGNLSNAWHGDVYRALALIRELHPMWDVSVINSGGNPQALLSGSGHREKYAPSLPAGSALAERVSTAATMTYAQSIKRRDEYNFVSEDEALRSLLPIG